MLQKFLSGRAQCPQRCLLHSPQIRPITNAMDLNGQLRVSSFGGLSSCSKMGGNAPKWPALYEFGLHFSSLTLSQYYLQLVLLLSPFVLFVTNLVIGTFSEVKKKWKIRQTLEK